MIRNVRNILTLNNRICRQKNKQLIQKEISLHMKQIQQKIKKIQKNQQKNIERFSTISQNEVESSSIASSTVSFILFGLAMYYTYSIT